MRGEPEGGRDTAGARGWSGKKGLGSRLERERVGLKRCPEKCLEIERFGQEGGEGGVEVAVG